MSDLEPTVDFASLEPEDIANLGLDGAERAFEQDVADGLTNGDSICIVVGVDSDGHGTWTPWGSRLIGTDAASFLGNIDEETGKLATAIEIGADSVVAYKEYGDEIPEGARRYTGAVYYTAYVETKTRGWRTMHFVGAASGVQGHFDQAAVYRALTRMAAVWAQQQVALYGKP